ncbi:unnamed protein product [Caenorhabditis bovis]|uniref:SAC3/GANP/THP3 conserved domain-containing protein n=1 Tax=Caenorhabditis bovis TaxID=2654633 RepID=A0A8S1F2Y8_9PELO|nr:unnamed protein product [Caenorhabditis bovis]
MAEGLNGLATCYMMCSNDEIRERITRGHISVYEASYYDNEKNRLVANPERMVAEYKKFNPEDERNSDHVRPPFTLIQTVDYLKRLYLCRRDTQDIDMCCIFLHNRMQAVVDELLYQKAAAFDCVLVLQAMIPFYVEIAALLKCRGIDVFTESEHCFFLKRLFKIWLQHVRGVKEEDKGLIDERILMYIVFSNPYAPRSVQKIVDDYRDLFRPETLRFVLDIVLAIRTNNYVKYFKLYSLLEPISKCCLFDVTALVRQVSMRQIMAAYRCPQQYLNVMKFAKWLGFNDVGTCAKFLQYYAKTNIETVVPMLTLREPFIKTRGFWILSATL